LPKRAGKHNVNTVRIHLTRAVLRVVADVQASDRTLAKAAGVDKMPTNRTEFAEATVIDDVLVATVERLVPLAPLHNPAALTGITAARKLLPDVPQVAVFDTAFHQTMPEPAYTYAVPVAWRDDHGIRRYGFHGTSHKFVAGETARLLGKPPESVNVIVLHLGNGASATAVAGGRSIDTSMGMTPFEGLMMGTRAGSIDPGIIFRLLRAGRDHPGGTPCGCREYLFRFGSRPVHGPKNCCAATW